MMNKVLEVKDLHVSFDTYAGEVKAVRGVSFDLKEGEVLAIVGESGCGKSVTAQTIMKLNPMPPARIVSGEIILVDKDIVRATEKDMMNIRGKDVSMIFQDPMTCLNPTMLIGKQLTEAIRHHQNLSAEKANEEALRLLEIVKIPNTKQRAKQFPHEFSGGMRQRVMIAMALSCAPKVLIADEPTTALDVTIQAQIMELLKEIKEKTNTAIILITHDLGVVASMADRVAVMYAGKIVETGTAEDIFYRPSHPYTRALLKSLPSVDMDRSIRLVSIGGTPPDLLNPPEGCPFASRCDYAMKICRIQMPQEFMPEKSHKSACWLLHENCPKPQVGGDK
jgi:oligopeptide transport system ATP-binding protein